MEYELYHHGILGMKWGVRRYQNADGSLTSTGKKRYRKDAKKLASLTGKAITSEYEYLKTNKRVYAVDEYGRNTPTGFDPSRGTVIHDPEKLKKAKDADRAYEGFKLELSKKYDKVVVDYSDSDLSTGRQYAKIILEKNGNQFVSEFVKQVKPFEIPVEFVTYKKNP